MVNKSYSSRLLITELLLVLLALLFLSPFYFVVVNSLKTFGELLSNAASLPKSLNFINYSHAWKVLQFPTAIRNSLVITVFGNIGLVLISSMAAYRLARLPNRLNRLLFSLFVAAMVIPFQAIMIPLVKVSAWFHLMNSLSGIILCYMGLGVSFTIFLYHGFVRSIPIEVEESAVVDGCTPYGVFWRIIFPLFKPMSITVILLNSLWIWNDFLLPLIMLPNKKQHTIQVAINSLFGQYTKQWDLALAALLIGIIPLMVFFLLLQKHIIEGITAGAVKG